MLNTRYKFPKVTFRLFFNREPIFSLPSLKLSFCKAECTHSTLKHMHPYHAVFVLVNSSCFLIIGFSHF
ncbi:uncharacterized protein BDW43DRAFT_292774 [Aspergillus alliaceus]|uniref:uncharacterized protein n=1 Tax=Petromyces alliaceus TaxID=209559 RepID=UPI0012A6709C|nr:uncharacterized protein BDW43DRAFT_292774 [Aspergillus alliaceus]KAB8227901.1 hypothetical protein BDW43DRAFT_292774 [Aspergillus alliaceus]